MGMSTHIEAIGKPDKKFHKMMAAYNACKEADIEPPRDVQEYFKWDSPHPDGFKFEIENSACCTKVREECCEGFQIEIAKLPENTTHIRFWNSY